MSSCYKKIWSRGGKSNDRICEHSLFIIQQKKIVRVMHYVARHVLSRCRVVCDSPTDSDDKVWPLHNTVSAYFKWAESGVEQAFNNTVHLQVIDWDVNTINTALMVSARWHEKLDDQRLIVAKWDYYRLCGTCLMKDLFSFVQHAGETELWECVLEQQRTGRH